SRPLTSLAHHRPPLRCSPTPVFLISAPDRFWSLPPEHSLHKKVRPGSLPSITTPTSPGTRTPTSASATTSAICWSTSFISAASSSASPWLLGWHLVVCACSSGGFFWSAFLGRKTRSDSSPCTCRMASCTPLQPAQSLQLKRFRLTQGGFFSHWNTAPA